MEFPCLALLIIIILQIIVAVVSGIHFWQIHSASADEKTKDVEQRNKMMVGGAFVLCVIAGVLAVVLFMKDGNKCSLAALWPFGKKKGATPSFRHFEFI